ncbi:hypothetical protein EMIHUDRAFT_260297 [Emiliania huxleyi CCMP1516]|uniref:Kinesin motor domain-containing protein n=2 Tax=Emiliania huxleyi TaxID=2903 RepID=A0A0D3KWC4_EMIH1|nr:hypothetical protein EMIHUDRAFT_260297 [Emiliania huxleyi CCMP1516]EOD40059.1 hypothetical protein EMIHUDRAFT_260297 [Emiliania huxleyi CCMP1516]|eukprot:XP_005792488.1 hypothetical protein EMIHUDRAFT_260297 [Emiliania huxleyi CCMP1516]
MSAESIKVAVRVRPFNGREKEQNSKCIIRMQARGTCVALRHSTLLPAGTKDDHYKSGGRG